MLGNTRFELSLEGDFAGIALVFLCPQGTERERVDGGASGGLGGNAYGARRVRLREPASSVASKKATITRHRRLFRVYRVWGIET